MVQAIITLSEHDDRVLTIVKGKYGLKTKSQAVNVVIEKFEKEFLEPELRPEYVQKLKRLEKEGKFIKFKTIEDLRRTIEHA